MFSARVNKNSYSKYFQQCLKKWQLLAFIAIPLVYLIIYKYIPMFGIQLAFRDYKLKDGIWNSRWVGLQNFKDFFSSYYFGRVIKNTLLISFYALFAGFPMPVIIALALNTMEMPKLKKGIETLIYMPHFISTVVLVSILFQFFNVRIGVYGNVIRKLTGNYAVDILAKATTFPHMYVWSGIWQNLGWDTIIYTAALSSVDMELHEAAEIDGASRFQRVLHIDLPTIIPTMAILLILNSGHIMSVGFEKVYLMQTDTNLILSEVISTYSYKIGLTGSFDFSYSTAISLFNSVVNMLMLLFVNRIVRAVSSTSLF